MKFFHIELISLNLRLNLLPVPPAWIFLAAILENLYWLVTCQKTMIETGR